MDEIREITEFKKSVKKLRESLDKDSRKLSRMFNNTSIVLSDNFKKLNKLDLSVNTRGLQKSLDGVQENFEDTAKSMESSIKAIKNSIGVTPEEEFQFGLLGKNFSGKAFDTSPLGSKPIMDVSILQELFPKYNKLISLFENIINSQQVNNFAQQTGQLKFNLDALKDLFPKYSNLITSLENLLNSFNGWYSGGNRFNPGGLFGLGGIFDSGGIVPGNFSQPVPVVAHGSEMILNPGQQATLFKMLNGQVQTEKGGQPNYLYAPQVRSGTSMQEVFDILNRNSRQFFSMVSEGVQKDSGLRNAVRSA